MASFKDLINGDKPILIDFHATWCGPCKMMAPTIQETKEKLGDKIKVIKIDIDKNQQLARNLRVKGVPTLMLYKDGDLLWQQSGVLPLQDLLNNINSKLG